VAVAAISLALKALAVFGLPMVDQDLFSDVLATAQGFDGTDGHLGIVGIIPGLVMSGKSCQFFGRNLDALPHIDEVGKIDVLANPVAILEFEASGVGVANGEAEEEIGILHSL
jgi:hypothetical protein